MHKAPGEIIYMISPQRMSELSGGSPGGGGGHLTKVWVSTVRLTKKAIAVTSSGRREVILQALYSEAVGHL